MHASDAVLDNPVWHALRGPHAHLAEASPTGRAARYPAEVSPFSGVDRPDEGGWAALEELTGPGGVCVLMAAFAAVVPSHLRDLGRWPARQMLAPERFEGGAGFDTALRDGLVDLGPDDVEDMVALTALTEPGPFHRRTIETGRYVGVREGGRLIAMAGERLRVEGAVEISAVCTHPDARRRGLGARLTAAVADRIRAEGDLPFLHVVDDNPSARRLYETMGFRTRCRVEAVAVHVDPARSGQPPH